MIIRKIIASAAGGERCQGWRSDCCAASKCHRALRGKSFDSAVCYVMKAQRLPDPVVAIHELPLRGRHARSLRLPDYDYSSPGAYFVTIVTRYRECLFGQVFHGLMYENKLGRIVRSEWSGLPHRYPNIETDEFVLMPNHVHGIVVVDEAVEAGESRQHDRRTSRLVERRRMLLPRIVGGLKMRTAKSINDCRGTPGVAVWQRNYYEHVIRTQMDLDRIRAYIAGNPGKWEFDTENRDAVMPGVVDSWRGESKSVKGTVPSATTGGNS